MSQKFNYIIASYFGKRRSYELENTELFLDIHLNFFNTNYINLLNRIIIVHNSISIEDIKKLNDIKNKYKNLPLTIIIKDNIGGSYYNYEIGILESFKDDHINYSFIFEDDYVPNDLFFYEPFFDKLKDNIFYVCQSMAEANTWEDMFGKSYAGLSNGLLDLNKIRNYYKKNKKIFKIDLGNEYINFSKNQVFFTDYLREEYEMDSLKTEYCHPVYGVDYYYYLGNVKGKVLIRPIFFNYFHFFKVLKNENSYDIGTNYFKINYNNEDVGVFTVSNISDESIFLKCDTTPQLEYNAYINFINFITFRTNIKKFYLKSKMSDTFEKIGFKILDDETLYLDYETYMLNNYNINLRLDTNTGFFYLDYLLDKDLEILFTLTDKNNAVLYSSLNIIKNASYWFSIGERLFNYDAVKVILNDKNNFIYEKTFETKEK